MNLAEALRSTIFRWSLAIATALLVQSAILAGLFYVLTARHAIVEVDKALATDCRSIEGLGRAAVVAYVHRRILSDVHRVDLVGLFDAGGRVVAGNIATLPSALATRDGPIVVGLVRTEPPDPVPNESRTMACGTRDGDRIVFARDTDELDYISSLSLRALWTETLPSLVLAGGLGIFLARRAQTRFARVETAIDAVMAGRLEERLPVGATSDPFDKLSAAVNAMLDRLEVAIGDLRCLGDDIAHELRTPLTRLRARLERGCQDAVDQAGFREVGERAVCDIDHALSMVSAILRIRAIEEARRGSEFGLVDLETLLADAADLYRPTAEDKHIAFSLDASRQAHVIADRDLLMEAVCNLIDNAIKFTPPGGHVTCSLAFRRKDVPVLSVADDGAGIASHERSAVLRRFHRGSGHGGADGHGIGLSLVAAIVKLHGFELEIGDAGPGCEAAIVCACAPESGGGV